MGLSRTVSEINGDFPTPYILRPTDGVPLELGIGTCSQKTRMMWLPESPKSYKIGLAV